MQYREFVYWVRDSLITNQIRHKFGPKFPYNIKLDFAKLDANPVYRECLTPLTLTSSASHCSERELDSRILHYTYKSNNKAKDIPVYPDTLCWTRMSKPLGDSYPIKSYSGTIYDALTSVYFSNPWFDKFPVVGLNQDQIEAFVHWKSRKTGKKITAQLTTCINQISIDGINCNFWQISPDNYKAFTQWVVDSVMLKRLSDLSLDYMVLDDRNGDPLQCPILAWDRRRELYKKKYINFLYDEKVIKEFYNVERNEFNICLITYDYWYYNLKQAAKDKNAYDYEYKKYRGKVETPDGDSVLVTSRTSFVNKESVPIFPGFKLRRYTRDSILWVNLKTYANDVSLLTYEQAFAYWHWYSSIGCKRDTKNNPLSWYMCPTEIEWLGIRDKNEFPAIEHKVNAPTKIVVVR